MDLPVIHTRGVYSRPCILNWQLNSDLELKSYRVFSHDFTAAISVSQNNETAAMLVSQTNPVGVELFSYVKTFFVPINLHGCWPRE